MAPAPRHVHFLGICGYAVSGAALLAKQMGNVVTGSDDHAYPPTTDILTNAGIAWVDGSSPENLSRWGRPDQVVVGNQTRATNPEYLALRDSGIPYTSEIEFFVQLSAGRMRLAACGTHGKTTTAGLLAHILNFAGFDPGLRLGSVSLDLGTGALLGSGPFVFEGDEYSTAPWDPRPKFLHITPHAACVTRLELDHPDIYPSLDAYRAPFVELAQSLADDAMLALCIDDAEVAALAAATGAHVITYGEAEGAHWRISSGQETRDWQDFTITADDFSTSVRLTFPGRHNAANATAAIALARHAGVSLDAAVAACATFMGTARRFQHMGNSAGVTVIDDYAHHPTECQATLAAARRRYPSQRLIAVHTPHTYSRTKTLLPAYASALSDADVVIVGPVEAARERGSEVTVTNADVAATVRGVDDVTTVESSDEALRHITAIARPGDVVVVLSLGGFDKLAQRLTTALESTHV